MNDITLFGVFVGMAVVAYILYTHKLDMKDFEARYAVQQPVPMTDAQPPISKRRKIREDSDQPLPGHEGLFGPLKKVEGGPIRVIRETPTLSLLMKDQAISTDNTEIREGAATNKRLREREEDKPNTDLKRKQAISSTISNVKRQAMFYNIDAFKNRREKFYEALSKLQASPGKPKTISSFVGSFNTTTQSPAKTITTQSNLYVSPSEQTSVVANAAPTIKKSLFTTNESKKEPHATMTPIFSKSEEIKDQPTPTISQFKPQETKPTSIFGATSAKPEASSTPAPSLLSGQPQSLFSAGKTETSGAEKQQASSSLFGKSEPGPTMGFGSSTASTPSSGSLLGSSNTGSSLFGGKTDTPTTAVPAVSSALFGGSTTSPSPSGMFGQSGGSSTATGGLFGNTATTTQGTGLFGNTATTTPKETAAPSGLFGAQTSPTSAPTTGGSLFGSTSTSSSTGGLFGSTSASSTTGGLFGAPSNSTTPALGTQPTTPATSLFGAQQSTPATTPATTAFGGPPASTTSTSPFGTQPASTTSASPFGTQPAPTTGFGTQPPTSTTGGFGAQTSTNGFGASTTPASPFGTQPQTTTGGFGAQPATTTGGFGAQPATTTGGFGAQPSSTGLFGNSANTGFGSQQPTSTTGFGSNPAPTFGQPTTPNSSLFGATNPSSPAPGSLFGSNPTSTQSGSLFGAQSSQPGSLFGSQNPTQGAQFGTQPSSSLFGNNPAPSGSLFGAKQPGTSFGTGFGAQGNTNPSQSLFGSTPGQGGTVTNPLFANKS